MATSIIKRDWKCTYCGYHQKGTMSYYKWRKAYSLHYDVSEKHQAALAKHRKEMGVA